MTSFQQPMQPWPALAPYGRTVRLRGGGLQIFLYEAGADEQPALLLIHGLGDEADTWRHVIAPLAERYHVLAPDLPGFGRSEKPNRAFTLAFLRDALIDLWETLGLSDVALMGSSLGGALAQSVALERPDRVTRLILIGGSFTARSQQLNPTILQMALPFLGERLYNSFRRDPQAAYDSLRPYYADLDSMPKADRSFLYQRVNERVWSDGQRRAYLSILRHLVWSFPLRQRAVEAQLARLSVPTLAVWGEHDHINSIESGRALIAIQPTARLVVVPGAGHLAHQEKPMEFLALIEASERA